jgi:hypothetical protein
LQAHPKTNLLKATKLTMKDWEALGYREVAPGQLERVAAAVPAIQPRTRSDAGVLERRFLELFVKSGGRTDELVPEFRFFPARKWRADFYHPRSKTLIELEGGLHINGRHNSPDGFARDAEKYNQAAALGYRLFRLPSKLLKEDYIRALVNWLAVPNHQIPDHHP